MWFRRAVHAALRPAVVVLPLWLLLGRGVVVTDTGWDFLLYLVLAPIVLVALGVVAGLTWFRASVRQAHAVSVPDAVVLPLWWAMILFHGVAWTDELASISAFAGVLLALVAFWSAISQLLRDTRRQMEQMVATFEQQAYGPPGQARDQRGPVDRGGYDAKRDPGPVIRIDPPSDR
jgi:hypothetical protein